MDKLEALQLIKQCEQSLKDSFEKIDDICLLNQEKVLNAFQQCAVNLVHMSGSTGYGYDDMGKPKLCELYKTIFNTEDALVCPHITCGTHALTLPLFGILRPGDLMLSITGMPYDTLEDVINGENNGSLKDFKIDFEYIDMVGDLINIEKALEIIKAKKPKMIYIQRSRGYSERNALSAYYIGEVIAKIKNERPESIIMVDNCYGEFTEDKEPTDFDCDIMAGSLIKNVGGGLAPTGGYVVGKKHLIELTAGRLTSPSLGNEVGSYIGSYYPFFEGIFIAPHVVAGAIKGNLLLGAVFEQIGIKSTPTLDKIPHDIIRSIQFGDKDKLIEFCRLVQAMSPIDSNVVPFPWDMPGYNDQVIMAAGTFVQGASIELSCDAPIRPPYICYIQGGLTYEHIKLLCIESVQKLINKNS